MNTIFKKLKNIYYTVAASSHNAATFRLIDIETDSHGAPLFSLQLVGKNICLKYSQQDLLNNDYIYQNVTEYERIIIKEYGKTIQSVTPKKSNLKILDFQKNRINSIQTDSITKKIIFTICVKEKNREKIISLTAKQIMKNKEIFYAMDSNDKIQISYYAGLEDILNENESLRPKKISFSHSIRTLFSSLTKKNKAIDQ